MIQDPDELVQVIALDRLAHKEEVRGIRALPYGNAPPTMEYSLSHSEEYRVTMDRIMNALAIPELVYESENRMFRAYEGMKDSD